MSLSVTPTSDTSAYIASDTAAPNTGTNPSGRIEGRLYLSDEFPEPKNCEWLNRKKSTEYWEQERDSCLRGEYGAGCGYGVLSRIQNTAYALTSIPTNAIMGACFFAAGVPLVACGLDILVNSCVNYILCGCIKSQAEKAEENAECGAGCFALGAACLCGSCVASGNVLYEVAKLPGNMLCPEFLNGVLNVPAADLAMVKKELELQEKMKK